MTEADVQPGSNEALVAAFARFKARTAWRVAARNAARGMYELVQEAESAGAGALTAEQQTETRLIRGGIERAVEAASYRAPGWQRLSDWYSGAGIETAWNELHRVSERLLLVLSPVAVRNRVGTIDATLRSSLKSDDPRLTPAVERLVSLASAGPAAIDAAARQELRDFAQVGNEAGDESHTNVRSLRNLLIFVGGVTTIALLVFATLHALAPGFLSLATNSASDAIEVWEVELAGVLGGTIAAVFTIAKLGGFSGPYRLPVYQALIRVPAGAIVALAAVVLMQSKQISALSPQSGLSVLAVALVFGYAPDVFLRFMDQKATSLLGEAQSKNNPTRPPLSQPLAQSASSPSLTNTPSPVPTPTPTATTPTPTVSTPAPTGSAPVSATTAPTSGSAAATPAPTTAEPGIGADPSGAATTG
jgi:hypothetical protein